MLLTDYGWVAVVDGDRFIGMLTPDAVYRRCAARSSVLPNHRPNPGRITDRSNGRIDGERRGVTSEAGDGASGRERRGTDGDGGGRHPARPGRQHPARAPRTRRRRLGAISSPRSSCQPGRQREGPPRDRDDRRRRARRAAASRAAPSSSRRRATPASASRSSPRTRVPLHLRDDRQDERREGRAAAGVRRRGRRVPHGGAARGPDVVLLGGRAADARDARRVPARPVLEPAQPGRARAHDRARDLAPDRRAASRTSSPASAPAAPSPASARYLKAQNPDVQIVGADPEGSVYSGGTGRPYLVEGVGEDFWPHHYDPTLVDRVVMVSDADSFAPRGGSRSEEGLLIGGSGGTAVHAALVVGARARARRRRGGADARLRPRLPLEDLRRRAG